MSTQDWVIGSLDHWIIGSLSLRVITDESLQLRLELCRNDSSSSGSRYRGIGPMTQRLNLASHTSMTFGSRRGGGWRSAESPTNIDRIVLTILTTRAPQKAGQKPET